MTTRSPGCLNSTVINPFTPGQAVSRLDNAEQICAMASDLSRRLITFATGGDPVKSIAQLPEMLIDAVDTILSGSNINTEFDLPGDLYDVALG
jgi:hypothetical protein